MRRMKLSKKYGGLQFFAGGETWEITAYTFTTSLSKIAINFTSAGQEFTALSSSNGSSYIVYYTATSSINVCDDATWRNDAYRTVTFATAPTGELLAWLQQNATRLTNKVVETSIRFGADALDKSYLGADSLDRIYLGTDLLYQTLNEYSVTETLSNVTTVGTHPVKILEGKSLTLKYAADANYELPDSVTVAGATSNWTKSTGTLVISNPTGDVTITITAARITYSITENLTNVTKTGTHPSVIAAGQTLVLNYAAAMGYNLPDTVTVTGASQTWNKETGTLTLTNPTGNVTVTVVCVASTPTEIWILKNQKPSSPSGNYLNLPINTAVYAKSGTVYKWINYDEAREIYGGINAWAIKYMDSCLYIGGYDTYGNPAIPVYEGKYNNEWIFGYWDDGVTKSTTPTDTTNLRTIKFYSVPTGNLLTWLQSNGTKQ